MLKRETARTVAIVTAVMAAFVAFATWATPFLSVFEFDTDEGINMAKALLVHRGYPLYSSIWSDQPPLVSWLLAAVIQAFGPSVVAARVTILFFGAILMACFFLLVRRSASLSAAILATALLAVSGYTAILSVSIRIGLVSVALMTASFCALDHSTDRQHKRTWAVVAGFLAGLSLLAKLFTAPLLVILAIKASQRGTLRSAVTGFIVGMCPLLFIGAAGWSQLFLPHVIAYKSNMPGHYPAISYFLRDFFLYALALGGAVRIFRRPAAWSSTPVLWLIYGLLVVCFHRPLFIHHLFLLIIPAAWLAALAIDTALEWNKYITAFGVLILVIVKAYGVYQEGHLYVPSQANQAVQTTLLRNLVLRNADNPWIFTDRPMYAIRAGFLVPPEIAVLSNKRILASEKKLEWLVDILNKYDIRQIVLARYTAYPASFAERVNRDFVNVPYDSTSFLHFVRRDPVAATKPNPK